MNFTIFVVGEETVGKANGLICDVVDDFGQLEAVFRAAQWGEQIDASTGPTHRLDFVGEPFEKAFDRLNFAIRFVDQSLSRQRQLSRLVKV